MERNETSVGGLPVPVFYPSVSSVSKNVWGVIDHIELLVAANFSQFLVSCFDVNKERNNSRLIEALCQSADQSQVILYDSGMYEVVWSRSKCWSRKKYLRTLKQNRVSHAFCLDECVTYPNIDNCADAIIDDYQKTCAQLGKEVISPILHCKDINSYVDVCIKLSKKIKPKLLAIPERELGFGIVEIASNIALLRKELNTLDNYQTIHILGTGNPLSMMAYAFAGADSFDGLDWCQTVVDYETATLHHTLHLELYAHQSRWGNENEMSFLTKCFMHNLDFYKIWMNQLRYAIQNKGEASMLEKYIRGPQKEKLINLID